MALLENQGTQRRLYLRAFHVFGRNCGDVDTALDSPDTSRIHASIRWEKSAWVLHDHSRNGTFVDAKAMPSGGKHLLAAGERVRFGARQCWTVLDLEPPCPVLLPSNPGLAAIELTGLHLLPDAAMPEVAVYQDERGQWLYEDDEQRHLLADGDLVRIGEHAWHYVQCMPDDATAVVAAAGVPPVQFNFAVSQNEEHVELSISTGRAVLDLGERSHHYGLLTLARQRLLDAERGFDHYSQGWLGTGELARMLHIDPKHLNMQMHRARQQISSALMTSPTPFNLIERRRGELRLGNVVFQIRRGAHLEGTFDPLTIR